MHLFYTQMQSYIAPTCFGVIYAILKEVTPYKALTSYWEKIHKESKRN
jgi:hypothetical protein